MNEITPDAVYWITRLDYVRVGMGVLVALCVVAIIGLVIFRNNYQDYPMQ